MFTALYQYKNKAIVFCSEIEVDMEKIEISDNTIVSYALQNIIFGEAVRKV